MKSLLYSSKIFLLIILLSPICYSRSFVDVNVSDGIKMIPLEVPSTLVDENVFTIILKGIKEQHIYTLQIEGDIKLVLSDDNPSDDTVVQITDLNTVSINNNNTLSEADEVILKATLNESGKQALADNGNITLILTKIICPKVDENGHEKGLGNDDWSGWIADRIRKNGGPHGPGDAVQKLIATVELPNKARIIDVDSELAKNSIALANKGCLVTCSDGTASATAASCLYMAENRLLGNVEEAMVSRVQDLPTDSQYFAAVGSCVFSHIPQKEFDNAMLKVFANIQVGGYFAGTFFGKEHGWNNELNKNFKTFVTKDELETLFAKNGFKILELDEVLPPGKTETINDGNVYFHEMHVVAQKDAASSSTS